MEGQADIVIHVMPNLQEAGSRKQCYLPGEAC